MEFQNFKALRLKSLKVFVLGSIISLICAFTVDRGVSKAWNSEDLMPLRKAARAITDIGQVEFYFAISAGLYIYSRWLAPKNKVSRMFGRTRHELQTWSAQFFYSLISTGILVHIVKFCFGRQRPHKSETFDPLVFSPWNPHWHNHSFPSGHTQVLFTTATMLSLMFPKQTKWIFSIAAILAFTRVVTHNHFFSDLIGGFLVGYIGTLWTLYFLHRRWQSQNRVAGKAP